MRGERGSVLAQVLIFSAVAAMMCATMMRARLQPALTSARLVQRVEDDLAAQGAVNRVSEVWARKGVCGSEASSGVSCVGAGCRCSCRVRENGGGPPREVEVDSSRRGAAAACELRASRRGA